MGTDDSGGMEVATEGNYDSSRRVGPATLSGARSAEREAEETRHPSLRSVYPAKPGACKRNTYFMTLEQDRRASAGIEPLELGRNFISLDLDLVGNGGSEHRMESGQFAIAYRIVGNTSIALRVRAFHRAGN